MSRWVFSVYMFGVNVSRWIVNVDMFGVNKMTVYIFPNACSFMYTDTLTLPQPFLTVCCN